MKINQNGEKLYRHHITPQCLLKHKDQSFINSVENIVFLTYKHHTAIHKWLMMLVDDSSVMKNSHSTGPLAYSYFKMSSQKFHYSEYGTYLYGDDHHMFGKHHTEETRKVMSEKAIIRSKTDEGKAHHESIRIASSIVNHLPEVNLKRSETLQKFYDTEEGFDIASKRATDHWALEENRLKQAQAIKDNIATWSDEKKKLVSENKSAAKKLYDDENPFTCPKCGKTANKQSIVRYHGLNGEKCDKDTIIEIFYKIKNGKSLDEVAEEYNISKAKAYQISIKTTWKHVLCDL